MPTVDDYSENPAIPRDPIKALQAGDFNPVPTMLGICKDEGAIYAFSLLKNIDKLNDNWKDVMATIFTSNGGNFLTKDQEASLNIAKRLG